MNEIIPIIENKDGINVVSSRTIAEQLNKRHSDVLESIESIFYPHKHKQLLIVGNHISEFLDFYKSNEIIGVPTFIVYNDYLDYCNNRKIRAVTKTKFTQTLGRLANLHTTTAKYRGKSVRIYN